MTMDMISVSPTQLPKVTLVSVGCLLAGLGVAALWLTWGRDDRGSYQPLAAGAYHPSFFREYELARLRRGSWITDPLTVAQKYAGATRLCPDSSVEELPSEPGQASYAFVNKCWAGIFAAKRYRVDLIERNGIWEIAWSGVKYKCSRDPGDPGSYMLTHSPFQRMRNPAAAAINSGVRSLAFQINPWRAECL